jgi:hypothetical protein
MMIGTNIGRKDSRDNGNGMIMNTMGRRESLGSGKYHLMLREDGLEVLRHRVLEILSLMSTVELMIFNDEVYQMRLSLMSTIISVSIRCQQCVEIERVNMRSEYSNDQRSAGITHCTEQKSMFIVDHYRIKNVPMT